MKQAGWAGFPFKFFFAFFAGFSLAALREAVALLVDQSPARSFGNTASTSGIGAGP
jgi:hypothetical protein